MCCVALKADFQNNNKNPDVVIRSSWSLTHLKSSGHLISLELAPYFSFRILPLLHKSLKGSGPGFLSDLLTRYKSFQVSCFWFSAVPRVKTKYSETAFSFYAAQMWNKLPEELRLETMLTTFKSELKLCHCF